jgi:predicted transcriptional regulator
MKSATAKNLHVPLPENLYRALRAAAAREGRPATQVARAAIIDYLRSKRRGAVEDELRAYVAHAAGGPMDLDEELEAATLEHLAPRKRTRTRRR